ncbi:mitochondrial sodium/calcium exchanger protein-like isoform X2 [Ostrea edulis]|uniref:mitochondrial sodium/calcium exchanger protein-like isoform X2 n=1 Tax=Ostrea edulis TaxID=37623 RepID=UPI0024AFDD33|nr:mitochondrial sodium/calcium exchanger protein-like isoform X2 [Ostrea edulis]
MKTSRSSPTRLAVLAIISGTLILISVFRKGIPLDSVSNPDPERINSVRSSVVLRNLLWYNRSNVVGFDSTTGNNQSGDNPDSSSDCSDIHKVNKSERCHFTKSTDDCSIDEGFIDYTVFSYCQFSPSLLPLALIILFIWWLFLFIGLAITADDYFCPALTVISKTLHLSHNIAGVTFLAFGNGAPDIFSAIAAIGNAKNGEAGLAFGALLGAGVFVTAVVAGTIAIIHPFDAMQRPFIRDIVFYLAGVFWTFSVMWDKKITKIEAIGFILLYIFYVIVVVLGRYIYQKLKDRPTVIGEVTVKNEDDMGSDGEDLRNGGSERDPLLRNLPEEVKTSVNILTNSSESEADDQSPFQRFLSAINPIDTENWAEMGIFKKIFEVFKCPMVFLLVITTPVVDYDEDLHKWNRYLNSLQLTTGLVFSSLATKVGLDTIGSSFPVWALVLIIGMILSLLVFFTSRDNEQPKYHPLFAYVGFVVAVVWIYSVANEVVNILQTFGVVFSISNAVLGLTLLAWGNSIGDLIADTVMARQGFPRIGISACFGGPLFNLLLGIGIPFTIATVKNGDYDLSITLEEYVLAGFLALSLLTSLIVVPLSKFRMSRPYGIALIVLYVVFLVVALLTESNVISADIN